MSTEHDVIIIGAGPAGLAAAAALRQKGIEPFVLDDKQRVGDSWRAHYSSLFLNSVKGLSALPFQPMPAHYPRYPSRDQIVDYLTAYAAQQKIVPCSGQRVEHVRFADGVWQVKTAAEIRIAKQVVVATGMTRMPAVIDAPGLESFPGVYMHSREFKTGADYTGKRALIVGGGNSAVDIAMDLLLHKAKVHLSIRSPMHFTPLDLLGMPAQVTSILLSFLPLAVADAFAKTVLRLWFGDLRKYGIQTPSEGPIRTLVSKGRPPTFDRGIVREIKCGGVGIRPGLQKVAGKTVTFSNGDKSDYDVIVFAIGYTTGLFALLPDNQNLLTAAGKPKQAARNTGNGLYFIGFNESQRGLLNEIGHEATRIASVVASG